MKFTSSSVVRAALTAVFSLFGVAAELSNGGGSFWMLASVDPQRQVRS